MFKIILSILLITKVSALELNQEEQSLFDKLDSSKSVAAKEIKARPKRFTYTNNNFSTQKFTAVLKKNAELQNLDGTKFYKTRESRILKVEEVSPGSPFSFIFNKSGEAVFICYSKDLERLNEKISLTPPRIEFKKTDDRFKSIDNDIELLLNLLVSTGAHQYDIFPEAESLSSLGFTSEVGLNSKVSFPMMFITSFNQVSGTNMSWTFANVGLKFSYNWKHSDETNLGFFLQAERTLYGSATINEETLSLHENKFSIGSSMLWKDNIFSVEIAKERLIFPSTTLLDTNNIINTDVYHTSFILKVGKQFEIDL